MDVRALESIGDGFDCCEHWCDHNLAMICVGDERLQPEGSINCLAERLVHFPVSGDYWFTHIF
jgi:hypothetical protein